MQAWGMQMLGESKQEKEDYPLVWPKGGDIEGG